MYEAYWGLERSPFDEHAEPEFFFRGASHHSALLKLQYLVENRLGAGVLAGGTGSGKTCLASLLGHELSEEFGPVVHVVFPQLPPAELLAYLAVELGADESAVGRADAGLDLTLRQIERQLDRLASAGRRPVLIVDDAHLIEDQRAFQALQLLLNFRRRGRIDFSLVLAGDRALLPRIRRIGQLDERIAVKALLQPLSQDETAGYVQHRLAAAGAVRPIFDADALRTLFELSGGVPRKINRLCDLALLVGYADGLKSLTDAEVEGVAEELTAVVPE